MESFDDLFRELSEVDEHPRIEAKRGSDFGKSMMQTICAFANEPDLGGGHLLLGVEKDPSDLFGSYRVAGIEDPDKLQMNITSSCATQFNTTIRPLFQVEQRSGRVVMVVSIPEAHPHEKPVHFTATGVPKGAFRRIGSSDVRCTDDDIQIFYQGRQQISYDETPIRDATLADFDPDAIAAYRRDYGEARREPEILKSSDEDLLFAVGAWKNLHGEKCPTVAGLMLFGSRLALRRCFPTTRVDYIRVAGKEWVEDPRKRYESLDMRGCLFELIPRVQALLLEEIPSSFSLPAGELKRRDIPRIPEVAIREAVVNALMHRDYRSPNPVQIIKYSNRLELRNPGFSLKSEEKLYEPGSQVRNRAIAAVLHETNYAENKGTGISTMGRLMEEVGLPRPTFVSDRDKNEFVITFYLHHFLDSEWLSWLGQFKDHELDDDDRRALVFVRDNGSITVANYRDFNRVSSVEAIRRLRNLKEIGLLELSSAKSMTYLPTDELLRLNAANTGVPPVISSLTQGVSPAITGGQTGGDDEDGFDAGDELPLQERLKTLPKGVRSLPPELREKIAKLGDRGDSDRMQELILELCSHYSYRPSELAAILAREQAYLARYYLRPLREEGLLEYTIPENPSHRDQAYRTVKSGREGNPK